MYSPDIIQNKKKTRGQINRWLNDLERLTASNKRTFIVAFNCAESIWCQTCKESVNHLHSFQKRSTDFRTTGPPPSRRMKPRWRHRPGEGALKLCLACATLIKTLESSDAVLQVSTRKNQISPLWKYCRNLWGGLKKKKHWKRHNDGETNRFASGSDC